MSERPLISKQELAVLSKTAQEAQIKLFNGLIQYRSQQDHKPSKQKKTKKRPAEEAAAAEPVPMVEKKKKEKKEKPEGWLCEGNVITGAECPLDPKEQVFVGQTNYAKKKRNICKACKKQFGKSKNTPE
jgi:hypothetical protein